MVQKSMEVQLDNGLEARPVAVFVQVASQYESTIYVEVDDKNVNAKSIMGMMSLGLDNGETLTVVADGSDESAAVAHIERFLSESPCRQRADQKSSAGDHRYSRQG